MATFGPHTIDASKDISVKLMNHLWSPHWWELGVTSGITISSEYVIYDIMALFNTFILAGVIMIMVWTTFMGVTGTAHEGVPLGRRFSTIWVPIRAAVGISFLAPIFSGLSILQIIILQTICFSIDYANLTHNTLIDSFFGGAGATNNISSSLTMGSVPGLDRNMKEVGAVVFKALIIQKYYTEVAGDGLQGAFYTAIPSNSGKTTTYQFASPDQTWIYNWMTGEIMADTTVSCDDAESAICVAKNAAMVGLINGLQPVASSFVHLTAPQLTGASIDSIRSEYVNKLTTYKAALSSAILSNLDPTGTFATQSKAFLKKAKEKGWLSLGAYYWIFSNATQDVLSEAAKIPQAKWADLNLLENWAVSSGDLDIYLEKSLIVINSMKNIDPSMDFFGPEDSLLRKVINWPADQGTKYFLYKMAGVDPNNPTVQGNKDVIINLQEIGHQIVFAGNSVMSAFFFSNTVTSTVGKWINKATGGTLTADPKSSGNTSASMLIIMKLGLVALIVLFLVYPLGIALAFYLPAIPMLIWILAGLQWVIGTITVMVGAPLWAAAHSLPDGEGFAGAHGREGYILVLNVLLRPTLMVLGFLVAFLGIRILGIYLFEIFDIAITAMNSQFSRGFVTIFTNIFLFGMIIIVAAQKLFGLIVYFPDIVLSFIGKHLPGGGEGADEQKVNAMFDRFKGKGSNSAISTVKAKGLIT